MDLLYLELNDDQGIVPTHLRDPDTGQETPNPRAGELDVLNNIGITIPIERPVMVDDKPELLRSTSTVYILPSLQLGDVIPARILPGTRIVEVAHPAVANQLLETGHYHQIDAPDDVRSRVVVDQATHRRKASDGTFIQVPDTVQLGVTPGWPVDEETGKPLNLTPEQREHLATEHLDSPDDQPGDDTTTPPEGEEA